MDTHEIVLKSKFSMLKGKINNKLLGAIRLMNIEKPTRIQAETLPHLLMGKDIIGAAKTGSGKTLAFLIPIIDNLLRFGFDEKQDTGCIILSPTRELALQTFETLKKLLVEIELSCALIVGGEKKSKDRLSLQEGINIIVSTPGRLLDHLENTEHFDCKNLKCLVVDEADKLLESGFEKHITGIISLLPNNRQTVLFSATIDSKVENLAKLALKSDPILISTNDDKQSTVSGLQQGYCICPVENRIPWLYRMLKKGKNLKMMGKQSQSRRKKAYHGFVEAEHGTLFCTDVAARGLDIPRVDWIIQYDPPSDPKEYIHRVGRTARGMNSKGNAVILLRPEEEGFVEYLIKEKVYLDKYSFGDPPQDVQDMLENLISSNGVMKTLARKAFLSFLRCYKTHPMKKIFNIKTLNINLAAKAFGFLEQPHVDFIPTAKPKKKRQLGTQDIAST